jgi:LRR receptor-like serine/threonine-protein kinase FLS2
MESGEFSIKGDVYSYGIVLLEMITGRSPYSLEDGQSLPHWVRATATKSKSLHDVLDPILMGADFRQHQQKMAMVLGMALLCSRDSPEERPTMADVWKMLTHIKTKSNGVDKGSRGRKSNRSRALGQTALVDEEIVAKVPNDPIPSPIQLLPKNPSFCDWTPRDLVGCSNPSSRNHKQR